MGVEVLPECIPLPWSDGCKVKGPGRPLKRVLFHVLSGFRSLFWKTMNSVSEGGAGTGFEGSLSKGMRCVKAATPISTRPQTTLEKIILWLLKLLV